MDFKEKLLFTNRKNKIIFSGLSIFVGLLLLVVVGWGLKSRQITRKKAEGPTCAINFVPIPGCTSSPCFSDLSGNGTHYQIKESPGDANEFMMRWDCSGTLISKFLVKKKAASGGSDENISASCSTANISGAPIRACNPPNEGCEVNPPDSSGWFTCGGLPSHIQHRIFLTFTGVLTTTPTLTSTPTATKTPTPTATSTPASTATPSPTTTLTPTATPTCIPYGGSCSEAADNCCSSAGCSAGCYEVAADTHQFQCMKQCTTDLQCTSCPGGHTGCGARGVYCW